MRVGIYVLSFSMLMGPAIAQQSSGKQSQPQSGSTQTRTDEQTGTQTQTGTTTKETTTIKGTSPTTEMKTQEYKGVLVDATCAMSQSGAGSTGMTSSSGAASTSTGTMDRSSAEARTDTSAGMSGSATADTSSSAGKHDKNKATSSSADRAAGDASCPVSSSTSQFALKLDDGRTLRFDMVGNQRAQEEIRNNKKWTDAASSGKPLKVKVHGAMSGDKLIVSSIK